MKRSDLKEEGFSRSFCKHSVSGIDRIQGNRSDKLKGKTLICANCNNNLTQKHDKDWEKLSSFLRKKEIEVGKKINLVKLFPGRIHAAMLNVHLYFAKQLGTYIQEKKNSHLLIDLEILSNAILNNEECPYLYISICEKANDNPGLLPLYCSMDNFKKNHRIVFAGYYYNMSNFSIRVIFINYETPLQAHSLNSWYPSTISKYIKIIRADDLSLIVQKIEKKLL